MAERCLLFSKNTSSFGCKKLLKKIVAVFMHIGEEKKAIESFKKAKELRKSLECVDCQIAKAFAKLEDYSNAIEFYKNEIQKGSKCFEPIYNITKIHLANKNYNEALFCLFDAKKSPFFKYNSSEDLKVNLFEALVYLKMGDKQKADLYLEKVKSFTIPLKANDLNSIAWSYYELEEYHRGLEYGREALKIERQPEILDTVACCLAHLGEEHKEEAIKHFKESYRLKRYDFLTISEFARLYEKDNPEMANKIKNREPF
ncbi:MAG: tetratricopeptide repeat protein [Candidatus Hodarchaeales archaeon]